MNKDTQEQINLKAQMHDLLDEAIRYYGKDAEARRATSHDGTRTVCQYVTDDGRMCAVGRKLDLDKLPAACKGDGVMATPADELLDNHPEAMPEALQAISIDFWMELQGLHDGSSNWRNKAEGGGLTRTGLQHVETMRDHIDTGFYR